jgi:dihydrofolate synthase/folylpolyglutamate synthase
LDHTEILGATCAAIAKEKAGIIKAHVPVIIGPTVPFDIISPIALQKHAPLKQVKGFFETYMEENMAIARAAMEHLGIQGTAQTAGLQAQPPCRMETHSIDGLTFVFDVAHNPNGLDRLFKVLARQYAFHTLRVVVGFSKSKNVDDCIAVLKQHGHYFYPVEAPHGQGFSASQLAEKLNLTPPQPTISNAILQAKKEAQKERHKELIVVCGSFYIMDEARQAILH